MARLRNPGPSWGYRFLLWADSTWPKPLFDGCLKLGNAVALVCMPSQRKASTEYLRLALGRDVNWRDNLRHFHELSKSLVYKLRIGRDGVLPDFQLDPSYDASEFVDLARSSRPALFGTFHVGHSDLTGCMLGEFGRRVRMVRQRVGNDYDLKMLEKVFGRSVDFVWINEGESMLFALKNAAEEGASLALQCDREMHASKHREFRFMGAVRRFPVTIYHLAYLLQMPVVFSFGIPLDDTRTKVVCSPVFEPDQGSRKEVLNRGYEHFQAVLDILEAILKESPYVWFNFLPMNTEVGAR